MTARRGNSKSKWWIDLCLDEIDNWQDVDAMADDELRDIFVFDDEFKQARDKKVPLGHLQAGLHP